MTNQKINLQVVEDFYKLYNKLNTFNGNDGRKSDGIYCISAVARKSATKEEEKVSQML